MGDHQVAQLNVGRIVGPTDSPEMAEFMAALDEINELAERSPGFVWRYTTAGTNDATAERPFDDDSLINFSVWESPEDLWDYAYVSRHLDFLRRRREWFHPNKRPHLVLWWIPAGHTPTIGEALERLRLLDEQGPGPRAFTFREPYGPDGEARPSLSAAPARGSSAPRARA